MTRSSVKISFILLLLFVASLHSQAQNPVPPGFQSLSATWKASPIISGCGGFTDTLGRTWTDPTFDDSIWSTITPPDAGSFNTPGLGPADRFYRGTFALGSATQPIFLFFVSDDSIEIFVNGTSVGAFSPFLPSVCHQLGCVNIPGCGQGFDIDVPPVQIPTKLLHQGTNVVAAHVSNGGGGSYFDMAVLTKPTVTAPPSLVVSTPALDFGRQPVGLATDSQLVMVMNSGGGSVSPSLHISGDYSETDNCTSGLGPGGSCAVNIIFTPGTLGVRNGIISITGQGSLTSPQIELGGFGALRFPLKGSDRNSDVGLTAHTVGINSVFDHSMQNDTAQYQIYGCDNVVTDFLDEVGDTEPSQKVSVCKRGYSQVSGDVFQVNGNYLGAGFPNILFYDGHPGFDYQSHFSNQVYAAASGTVRYPTTEDLVTEGVTVGADPDNFQVLELDAANDVKVFYLHLSTHPRAISKHLTGSLDTQDFVGTPDKRFSSDLKAAGAPLHFGILSISGSVTVNGEPLSHVAIQLFGETTSGACVSAVTLTTAAGAYELDGLAEGFYNLRAVRSGLSFAPKVQNAETVSEFTHVTAGELIGNSGNAGSCTGKFGVPPHLHFEVQRKTSTSVTDHAQGGPRRLAFIPVDPYGWQPLTVGTADPYFQIPDLQNSGLVDENLWELVPVPVPEL
jgi:hypothetical protein